MDKKEILEKSRKENDRGDEYEKDIMLKGYKLSSVVTATIVVFFLFYKFRDYSYVIILTGMVSSYYLYNAIKTKTKTNIFATVGFGVAFVIYTILYVANEIGII